MSRNLRLNVTGMTDIGLIRKNNEDYYAVNRKKGLFIVSDGMGGAKGGEVASRLAVETVMQELPEKIRNRDTLENSFADMIKESIQKANDTVIAGASREPGLQGMGTTIVLALFIPPDSLHIASVGDSRAYLFRKENLALLTEDHSIVGELVRNGELTPEGARLHRLRNMLTQAIGTDLVMRPYQKSITLQAGDTVLLCSDGLWDMLPDEEIERLMSMEKEPDALCRLLIDTANQADGEDNITLIAISVKAPGKDKQKKLKKVKQKTANREIAAEPLEHEL